MYGRVFKDLKPRTPLPQIQVEFCRFANANSFIRLDGSRLHVRIADALQSAPAPIQEALAYILIAKLYRKTISGNYAARYRRYLNRADVRKQLDVLRQERGRKFLSGPRGEHYDLEPMFEDLNRKFFHGLMSRPALGWSRQRSRTMLGHYDPSHNAIVLSRILDQAAVPSLAVEYVMYHEMLHLRYPTEHRGARRCVHTPEFKRAEKEFPHLKEALALLKLLPA